MVWAVSLLTMDLSTHRLTPEIRVCGIRSLTGLGNPWRAPHPISALPPRLILEASPKAISGRTSYLRVRLEFLRYPHLIPAFFNMRGFGPPVSVTSPSPWTGVDHTVSGLRPRTSKQYKVLLLRKLMLRPIQTRFRCGSGFSPFPHGTASLSVAREYLALADGPAGFIRGFTCPALLGIRLDCCLLLATGLLPSLMGLSRPLRLLSTSSS